MEKWQYLWLYWIDTSATLYPSGRVNLDALTERLAALEPKIRTQHFEEGMCVYIDRIRNNKAVFWTLIDYLGERGWEMVGFESEYRFWFKRPIPESTGDTEASES